MQKGCAQNITKFFVKSGANPISTFGIWNIFFFSLDLSSMLSSDEIVKKTIL
jgi:hypothetical protein